VGITDEMVRTIMAAEGPVVSLVVLRAGGSVEEVTLDMTPRLQNLKEFLGGDITIIGGYDNGAVVVAGRSATAKSPHALPFPHHEVELFGDVAVMRTGENGVPLDFKSAEFEEMRGSEVTADDVARFEAEKKARAEQRARELAERALGSGGDGDEEEEESEDEEYTAEMAEKEDEEESEGEESEESDEGEEEEVEATPETQLLQDVIQLLCGELGRAPSMDEIKDKLREIQAAQLEAAANQDPEEDEDDEEEEEESGEEEEEVPSAGQMLELLMAAFEEKHKRAPTEEEVNQWRATFAEAATEAPAETPAKLQAPSGPHEKADTHSAAAEALSPDSVVFATTPGAAPVSGNKRKAEAPAAESDKAPRVTA